MTKAEAIAMLKRIQEPEAWEPQINQAVVLQSGLGQEEQSERFNQQTGGD